MPMIWYSGANDVVPIGVLLVQKLVDFVGIGIFYGTPLEKVESM